MHKSTLFTVLTLLAATLVLTSAARASTVVNIDARQYGDAVGLGTLDLEFAAGSYTATVVNPSIDSRAAFTAWSHAFGWPGSFHTDWRARRPDDTLIIGGDFIDAASASEAFAAMTTNPISFTLDQTSLLRFYVADNRIDDNQGGVSVLIEAQAPATAAPVPAASGMGIALLGLLALRHTRRRPSIRRTSQSPQP